MRYLALDIGGTKIAAARVDEDGGVVSDVLIRATPAMLGSAAVVDAMVRVLCELDDGSIDAIGIASAGVVDSDAGVIMGATASITGWQGTEIARSVRQATGHATYVLGDGHAFGLGEAVYGLAHGADSLLVLAVGTGVGGSFVRTREPLFGSHWVGGHFGHVSVPQAEGLECYCGRTGHLEAIGSGMGMTRWYHQMGGGPHVRGARELVERASTDSLAAQAIELGAAALGTAAGGLANAFDPDVVVIAGGLAQVGSQWETSVRSSFMRTLHPTLDGMPLITSEPGAWLALRGAAYFAQSRKEQS